MKFWSKINKNGKQMDHQITMEEFESYLTVVLTPWEKRDMRLKNRGFIPRSPEEDMIRAWSCEKRKKAWNCYNRLRNREFIRDRYQIIEARDLDNYPLPTT